MPIKFDASISPVTRFYFDADEARPGAGALITLRASPGQMTSNMPLTRIFFDATASLHAVLISFSILTLRFRAFRIMLFNADIKIGHFESVFYGHCDE